MAIARTDAQPAGRAARTARVAPTASDLFFYGLAIALAAVALFPFFWTVTSSLKETAELFVVPPSAFPATPQWGNYREVFVRVPFGLWVVNTTQVALAATLGTVVSATIVAYSFARFRYAGRDVFFFLTVGTLILPAEVTVVPTYLLFRQLGWLDTYGPLVVPFWLGGGAFYIFLLRQFFMTIPRDLDEAAKIDGAGSLRILTDVLAPLLKPALTAVTIISFINHWDEFFGPLIYLNTPTKFVLSLGIRYFHSSLSGEGIPMAHLLMVAATLATLPPILLFIAAQRYFVQGVVMSGLKG
jgi:ABC-type glycerol-3-phosphate transport system permease component